MDRLVRISEVGLIYTQQVTLFALKAKDADLFDGMWAKYFTDHSLTQRAFTLVHTSILDRSSSS